ncbi:MAG: periplasmic heavy metal sensor, partial [Pseudomonadota bacterium]
DAPTRKPVPLWLKITLVVSLGLNLLVLGVIGGVALRGGPQKVIEANTPPGLIGLVRALPEDRGLTVRTELREEFRDGTSFLQRRRKQTRDLREAITAVPFDADVLEAVMERERGQVLRFLEAGHGIILVQLADMTDEERAQFVDKLSEQRRRPPRSKSD